MSQRESQAVSTKVTQQWPLWKVFPNSEREYMAGLYEGLRSIMIATGARSLRDFERRWEDVYGFTGSMESVVSDMQEAMGSRESNDNV